MGTVSVLDVTATRQTFEPNEIDVRWAVNIAAITLKPPTEYHVDLLAPDGRVLENRLVAGGSFALFNGVKNERTSIPYKSAYGDPSRLSVRVESWEKTVGWHKTSERVTQVRKGLIAGRPEGGESVLGELTPDIGAKGALGIGLGLVALVAVAVVVTQGASLARTIKPGS